MYVLYVTVIDLSTSDKRFSFQLGEYGIVVERVNGPAHNCRPLRPLEPLLKLATRPPNVTLTRLRYRLGVVALKIDAFFGNFSMNRTGYAWRNYLTDPSITRWKFNITYRDRDDV
jgi:hypothetical protein